MDNENYNTTNYSDNVAESYNEKRRLERYNYLNWDYWDLKYSTELNKQYKSNLLKSGALTSGSISLLSVGVYGLVSQDIINIVASGSNGSNGLKQYFTAIFIIILGSGKFTIDNLKKLRYDIYMLNENKKKIKKLNKRISEFKK